jgi:predicted DNA-binding protein YlxM (UPF0122 family)
MEKFVYLNELYDLYGKLLTDKQQKYFEDYYFNNLTLQEISENNNVSRNNAYKIIKDAVNKLNYYEEKLKLIEKKKKIEEIIKDKKILEEIEEYI